MMPLSVRLAAQPPAARRGPERRAWRPGAAARVRRLLLTALLIAAAALLGAGYWLPAKAALAQHLLNRAWNAASDERSAIRPWPWADTWPVARLALPGSRAPLTVLAGASGRNLAFGPALMDGSAAPGTAGVSVIAGHRDTHFRALAAVQIGERFELEQRDGNVHTFEVTALEVIDAEQTLLRLDADEPLVALVTCYPFDAVTAGGSLRYVVTAHLVRPADADDLAANGWDVGLWSDPSIRPRFF
jgi:sortase A